MNFTWKGTSTNSIIPTNSRPYTNNDPIAVKQKLLQEINVDKQRLLLELRALKNEG